MKFDLVMGIAFLILTVGNIIEASISGMSWDKFYYILPMFLVGTLSLRVYSLEKELKKYE